MLASMTFHRTPHTLYSFYPKMAKTFYKALNFNMVSLSGDMEIKQLQIVQNLNSEKYK